MGQDDSSELSNQTLYPLQSMMRSEEASPNWYDNMLDISDERATLERAVLCNSNWKMSHTTRTYYFSFNLLISIHFITKISSEIVHRPKGFFLFFHIVFLFLMLILAYYLVFDFMRNFDQKHKRFRQVFNIYGTVLLSYLFVSDDRLLMVKNADEQLHYINSFLYLGYLIIFSHICYLKVFLFQSVLAVISLLILSILSGTFSSGFKEIILISLYLTYVNIETYKDNAKAIKHTKFKEEEKELFQYINSEITMNHITFDSQVVFSYLETILSNVQAIFDIIYLKKVKNYLTEIIQSIELIKFYILNHTKEVRIDSENVPNDSEDFLLAFCSENDRCYCLVKSISLATPHKNKLEVALNDKKCEIIITMLGEELELDLEYVKTKTDHFFATLAEYILLKWSIMNSLGIEFSDISKVFSRIQSKYNDMSFYSDLHAAQVLNNFLFLFSENRTLVNFDSVICFGSVLACLGHDIGKKKISNHFIWSTKDSLTIQYNDKSPQESLTCSMIFEILQSENVMTEHWDRLRRIVIYMILYSSFNKHFQVMAKFKLKTNDFHKDFADNILLALTVGLKCADLGFLAYKSYTHARWMSLLQEELYKQGDNERERFMPVSVFCDREFPQKLSFVHTLITYIGVPMFQHWAHFMKNPRSYRVLEDAIRNQKVWVEYETDAH